MIRFNEGHLADGETEWEDMGNGVSRKILAFNDALMMLRNRFETGGVGAPHSHPHVQCSYVIDGRFEITIDGKSKVMEPGDSFLIPSDVVHSARCLSAGDLIEVFTPMREDFFSTE